MRNSTTLFLAIAVALALAPLIARADDDEKLDPSKLPPAATKTGVTYDADIKPILDTSCVKCHKGEKPRAKLRLDSLDGLLKGGKDGKVIVTGDLTKGSLVFAVAHVGDEDDFMPPPRRQEPRCTAHPDQVGLIRAVGAQLSRARSNKRRPLRHQPGDISSSARGGARISEAMTACRAVRALLNSETNCVISGGTPRRTTLVASTCWPGTKSMCPATFLSSWLARSSTSLD